MRHIWRIIRFTGSLWRYYLAISGFTILLAAMSQIVPIITKAAIDLITGTDALHKHPDIALIAFYAFLIFLTDIGTTIFSNLGGYLGDMMSAKLTLILSEKYYQHLLKLSQSYFDTELTGKIINRMNRGITQIGDFLQTLSNNFLQFLFSTIFTLLIVAYYSWPVALMLLAIYPVFFWLTGKTSVKWQKYQARINKNTDIAIGRFTETIGQIKVVKSFIQETSELLFFGNYYKKVIKITRPQSKYWHKQDNFRRFVLAIIFFAVFMFIFIEAARGVYNIGTMVLLIQYAALIRIPIFSISFLVDQTQRAISNSKDYFEVMDIEPEITDSVDAKTLEVKKGEVIFNDVDFAYDDQNVLNKLSFTLKPDTKTALVGESGEGKTTITNLLMRLYEPGSGQITIDGQNIAKVSQKSLRLGIGVVFQEPALFSGTVRENIAYSNIDAKEDDVVAAARAANADEFISKFEKGYDTEIGERGLKLSGGQKQRIAIARALLKNAPILILDEATSSLDSKSEHLVHEALERLMKNRTTLIIAHRLSTIKNVDTIITISGGKVQEVGTPSELAESGGIYAQLLKLQQTSSEATKKKLKTYDISD
ncbi:MAG TPA: ABC transporter ATP-binding protein [Candidatus Saccharimonadales bacterium]|nr:ABC transporter ATP-binding protein [Candidatus Saccharimonadales bacterium]